MEGYRAPAHADDPATERAGRVLASHETLLAEGRYTHFSLMDAGAALSNSRGWGPPRVIASHPKKSRSGYQTLAIDPETDGVIVLNQRELSLSNVQLFV